MKSYSLEDKIRIIEEFKKNGGEIKGTTTYQDCPIGQWDIMIRYQVKKYQNGEKSNINPTDEQLKKLERIGVLESQIEATIDEKIERMAEWVKKYPRARLVNLKNVETTLKEYSSNDDEYEKILEKYKKMQGYYDYARQRKCRGKLTDEQMKALKEANIAEIFGYSDEVEELDNNYVYYKDDLVYLLQKYGSIDNFHKLYLNKKIKDEYDLELAISKANNFIDVDENNNNKAYEKLVRYIMGHFSKTKIVIYSSEKINEIIKELTPREKSVIESGFDLNDKKMPRDLENISQEVKSTRKRMRHIEIKALRKLRCETALKKEVFELDELKALMTEDEKKEFSQIDERIVDACFRKNYFDEDGIKKDIDFLKKVMEEFKERTNKKQDEEKNEQGITYKRIEELDLSVRAYNYLRRAGFSTIDEIKNLTEEDLLKIRNMSKNYAIEVLQKLEKYREQYETISQDNQEHIEPKQEQDSKENSVDKSEESKLKEMPIEELELSVKAYNCLKRGGYNTLEEIVNMSEEDFLKVRNMKQETLSEIMEKIEPYREKDESEEMQEKSYDLQSVKAKRDELQEMINQLKSQMNQAQSLLDECNEVLGENKEDKKPNLED